MASLLPQYPPYRGHSVSPFERLEDTMNDTFSASLRDELMVVQVEHKYLKSSRFMDMSEFIKIS